MYKQYVKSNNNNNNDADISMMKKHNNQNNRRLGFRSNTNNSNNNNNDYYVVQEKLKEKILEVEDLKLKYQSFVRENKYLKAKLRSTNLDEKNSRSRVQLANLESTIKRQQIALRTNRMKYQQLDKDHCILKHSYNIQQNKLNEALHRNRENMLKRSNENESNEKMQNGDNNKEDDRDEMYQRHQKTLDKYETDLLEQSENMMVLQHQLNNKDALVDELKLNIERLTNQVEEKNEICNQYKAEYDELLESSKTSNATAMSLMELQQDISLHEEKEKHEALENIKVKNDVIVDQLCEEVSGLKTKVETLELKNNGLVKDLFLATEKHKVLRKEKNENKKMHAIFGDFVKQWMIIQNDENADSQKLKIIREQHIKLSTDLVKVIKNYEHVRNQNSVFEEENIGLKGKINTLESELVTWNGILSSNNNKSNNINYKKDELHYYKLYNAEKAESLSYQKLLIKANAKVDLQKAKCFTLETTNANILNKLKKQKMVAAHKCTELETNMLNLKNEYDILKTRANATFNSHKQLEEKIKATAMVNKQLNQYLTISNNKIQEYEKTTEDAKSKAENMEKEIRNKTELFEDQAEDFERKYEAENAKRQESEKTLIEVRHSLKVLQNLLKKTQADHIQELEEDDAKYQKILKEKNNEHKNLTATIYNLEHKVKEIEYKTKAEMETFQNKIEALQQGKHTLQMEVGDMQLKYKQILSEKDAKIHNLSYALKDNQRSLKDTISTTSTKIDMLEKKVTQLIKACSILEGDKISLEVQIKASTLKLKETSAQHEKELGKNLDLEDQMRIKNDQLINKETEIDGIVKKNQKLQVELHEKTDEIERLTRKHDEMLMVHGQHQDGLVRIQDRYDKELDDIRKLLSIEQGITKKLSEENNAHVQNLGKANTRITHQDKEIKTHQRAKQDLENTIQTFHDFQAERNKLNDEIKNNSKNIDSLKQKISILNGDKKILETALQNEKEKAIEVGKSFKSQTKQLQEEHKNELRKLEEKIKQKRMEMIKETFKRTDTARKMEKLHSQIKALEEAKVTSASKLTETTIAYETKIKELENRILAYAEKIKSANEIHSILANIALMNEEDKLILQQRHFDEVTHLKHALKVRSDEAEDLHNKMHHLIFDRVQKYRNSSKNDSATPKGEKVVKNSEDGDTGGKNNNSDESKQNKIDTSTIEEWVRTLEMLLHKKETKINILNTELKLQEKKYIGQIHSLNVYNEMNINRILNESSNSEKQRIATEQHLQKEIHEHLHKTHHFHAEKYSQLEEKLNDETKLMIDKADYEKEKEEHKILVIKLKKAEENIEFMNEQIEELQKEMNAYAPKRLSKAERI